MRRIMDAMGIKQTVAELATRLLADPVIAAAGTEGLALIGIRNRGEVLALRLADQLSRQHGLKVDVGALDITLYRDDLFGRKAITIPLGTEIDFPLDGRVVVLIDDVLYTGRSTRAALDAITDFGRPRVIRLLSLVERPGREYPIAADFVGLKLGAEVNGGKVSVRLQPTDPEDAVDVGD